MLAVGAGAGSLACNFADAEESSDGGMGDGVEVGVVVGAGDRDPASCCASLGGGSGELRARCGERCSRAVEFRVEARGSHGELGLAPHKAAGAGVDLAQCREEWDGG